MSKNVLIVIDIQKEYTTPNRPFYLKGIDESLKNCLAILNIARNRKWEIIHIKHLKQNSVIFNRSSAFSDFHDDFLPEKTEIYFEKNLYSCYSNQDFSNLISNYNKDEYKIYIIGYNTIMCCLSTVVEGYHKGHKLTLIEDAMLAKSTSEFSEIENHQHAMSIIKAARYAEIITSQELLKLDD